MNTIVDTSRPPEGAIKKASFSPKLLMEENHHLCSGCGHPIAVRIILETISDGTAGKSESETPAAAPEQQPAGQDSTAEETNHE